jgi:hypothetical protein
VHAGGDTDSPHESLDIETVVVITRGDDKGDDESGLFVGAEEREIFGRTHLNGDGTERIDDRRAERHQRERRRQVGLEDVVFALSRSQAVLLL